MAAFLYVQGKFSMKVLFTETHGNGWTLVKVEILDHAMKKARLSRQHQKSDRIAKIEEEDKDLPQKIMH